jgi:eukaryotic-like serine/threonine-protein kinase
MSTGNLYKSRNRLPANSEMYFGRTQEMEHLIDMISANRPQSVSIVGERRIGKSSLAYRVCHKIKKKNNTIAIYLDCDELPKTCKADADFYKLLNDGFKKAKGVSEAVDFSDYRGLKTFVGRVSKKNMKVVIFLDEFEHLPEMTFADNSFFSNLRALADNPDYSLAFVTISKTDIKELTHIHKAIQSSCFYNIFETRFIGLLDHDSINQLRRKGFNAERFALSEAEMKKIQYYAGNFAFFNQVACAFLWDTKHYEKTPDWDDLEYELLKYYETLWDGRSREEQTLLKKLKKENESNDFGLKGLKLRGLLTRGGNLYYPFSDFFGELIDEQLEVKKKDISEKGILKTTKELLDLLGSAKKLIPGKEE